MKNYNLISKVLLCIALFFCSCQGVFIVDPINPQLPKYTAQGNMVAGAFVGSEIWRSVVYYKLFSTENLPELISYPAGDSITLIFNGETPSDQTSIEFHLKNLKISAPEDLLLIKGKKFQLDGTQNSGFYHHTNYLFFYNQKELGQIYFKDVFRRDSSTIIVAGTFGLSFNDSLKITFGRFDYKLSNFQFMKVER